MDGLLVARAPLQISFGGSANGFSRAYERLGGTAVSATVGYYVYAIVSFSALSGVQIVCGDRHMSLRRHGRPRQTKGDLLGMAGFVAGYFNVRDGLALFLAPQVSAGGGLGLAGSAAVAVVKALTFCSGLDLEPLEVADMAAYIESDKMGLDVNLRDRYAAAVGGINRLRFDGRKATVEPLVLPEKVGQDWENGLMLFSSPMSRKPSHGLSQGDVKVGRQLEELASLSQHIGDALCEGDLDAFGELLHRSWVEKARIEVRPPLLDECYRTARRYGALGGDWSGDGERFFLVLYCPGEAQAAVTWALQRLGLQRWPCTLESAGVQVMQAAPWSRTRDVSSMLWSSPAVARSRVSRGKATARR